MGISMGVKWVAQSRIAVVFLLATVFPCLASSEQRGRIHLSEKSFNFGSVPAGQLVTREFTIRNSGSGELRIIGTSPSCGCTVASFDPQVIAPGQSAVMKVEFDTSGFSGEKKKTVEIFSDDPSSPRVGVTMTGRVLPGPSIDPPILEFGNLIPGDPPARREKRFAVRAPQGSGSVSKVTSASPFIEISEIERGAEEASYLVSITSNAPQGHFRDRVVVEFAGRSPEAINVPIVALIEGDIAINPPTISFGVVSGTKPLERRVSFEYRSKEPLTINGVSTSDSAVSAFYQPSGKGMNGTIVVKLDPQKVRKDLKATVEISTNHPSQPSILLNVYATIPAS